LDVNETFLDGVITFSYAS